MGKSFPQPHYGAMSFHGIPKPVWRAFQLLHTHAGSHTVNTSAVTSSHDSAASVGGGARASATAPPALPTLVSAATSVNLTSSGAPQPGSARVFLSHWDASGAAANHSAVTVTVTLHCPRGAAGDSGAPAAPSVCPAPGAAGGSQVYMIDDSIAANLAWAGMGSPTVPSPAQLAQLKAHSEMKPRPVVWEASGAGVLTAQVVMPPNSGCVLTL